MTLNRDQLIKLLNLTGSEYDAEALNAIRRANALLRKHRATWADLLSRPKEPAEAQQPEPMQPSEPMQQSEPTQTQQRPRPRDSDAFKVKSVWNPKVRHAEWHGYRATSATKQVQFSRIGSLPPSLSVLFFPITVYIWLYEGAALTRRRWLKPVAILVPIFGGGTAALIWVFLLLAVAQLMGIA
jgi:hypothetical protein